MLIGSSESLSVCESLFSFSCWSGSYSSSGVLKYSLSSNRVLIIGHFFIFNKSSAIVTNSSDR